MFEVRKVADLESVILVDLLLGLRDLLRDLVWAGMVKKHLVNKGVIKQSLAWQRLCRNVNQSRYCTIRDVRNLVMGF